MKDLTRKDNMHKCLINSTILEGLMSVKEEFQSIRMAVYLEN
jgi:hypothetical protein